MRIGHLQDHELQTLLDAGREESISSEQLDELSAHLDTCERCRAEFEDYRTAVDEFTLDVESLELSSSFSRQVVRQMPPVVARRERNIKRAVWALSVLGTATLLWATLLLDWSPLWRWLSVQIAVPISLSTSLWDVAWLIAESQVDALTSMSAWIEMGEEAARFLTIYKRPLLMGLAFVLITSTGCLIDSERIGLLLERTDRRLR